MANPSQMLSARLAADAAYKAGRRSEISSPAVHQVAVVDAVPAPAAAG